MTSPATPLETRNPKTETMLIDGRPAVIGEARNILEAVRAAGIDLPTFCYHSELSVHGACRLCLVDIEGKGIVASCSALPEPGLKIRTQTEQLRRLRRTTIELLLASHRTDCPSCDKAEGCRLQEVARRVGIDEVRFAPEGKYQLIDRSSAAITRDPSK
jgi:NADH-quinone oxidoreductase subunit G